MTRMDVYKDNSVFCFSNVRLDDGSKLFISVGRDGVSIKDSKLFFFGSTLFNESNIDKCVKAARALAEIYPFDKTPKDINNPVLKSFTNAALHCDTVARVCHVTNNAIELRDAERNVESTVDKIDEETNQKGQSNFDIIIDFISEKMESESKDIKVYDQRILPFEKHYIKQELNDKINFVASFIFNNFDKLKNDKKLDFNIRYLEMLGIAYMYLAQFQPDVGSKPILLYPDLEAGKGPGSATKEDIQAQVNEMTNFLNETDHIRSKFNEEHQELFDSFKSIKKQYGL